jgi:ketosteroid isomerase-like protein
LEFIDAGDRVVMPMTARGRPHGSAQTVEVAETQVYTVRNGKIVEVREYRTKAGALKVVGLSQ